MSALIPIDDNDRITEAKESLAFIMIIVESVGASQDYAPGGSGILRDGGLSSSPPY